MPQSNSDDDEDSDIRNYKKRRMLSSSSAFHNKHPSTSPSASSPPEVMDQVRSTLKLKQQQKAIIEARQSGASGAASANSTSAGSPSKSKDAPTSSGSGQPVTEKTSSGISVFHGSESFAATNRRPLMSPKSHKNAKSLTIFAPSYSDSSLSIHSAPLQPSHAHQAMSMNPRTSQPIRNHTQPHPLSLQAQHTGTIPQPLRSPKTAGHVKKPSRVTLRTVPHTAGLDNSSGTLPAPILSSHTGPLPSPAMYPIPPTPFHPSSHASLGGPAGHVSKPAFMETVSSLFDSVDSSRSLKHTLEEQIRKSAQLLQTLQSSGTMIESLVRGQFKELEKGVIERFEGELEYLSTRVRLLEEHQGLTPPPKKARISAVSGATKSTNGSLPSPPSISSGSKVGGSHDSGSDLKDGTLPTPPFNKNQDSAMEIEDEEPSAASSSSSTPASSSPREQPTEYHSSVKKLQERVANLEKRHETVAQA
ncbi:hypothetical protein EDD21DRAFT_229549 [Dissophora ornata]|nr:hypothetical protein EDD21DRAFT_229549 [Dissophora ornata]